jgi:hypothetical protein
VARAAVRAKQAQQAQAQAAAKPARGQRGHASGGNPNQDLFFTRIRRKQKWVFLVLAVLFAISFAAIGVGSGSGGLGQVFNGILGTGDDPVAKALGEVKTNPAKGYRDLANAYVTKNDLPAAITALKQYVAIKKTDAAAWTQLGSFEKTQGDTYAAEYQQVLQATSIQAPSSIFALKGHLQGSFPTNPIDDYYTRLNQNTAQPLFTNAQTSYASSLTDFQNAAKYVKKSDLPNAEQAVANAAAIAGQGKVAVAAWQRYIDLVPDTPQLAQIEDLCKRLGGKCAPKHKTK